MQTDRLKIAVLSGKGGTGKTLVSVNLAAAAASAGSAAGPAAYIDCDVEEPNGHLYFKPLIIRTEAVSVKIPSLNPARCVGCRTCVDFCQYGALAFVKNKPLVFDEVCHSCGGCALLCPEQALTEKDKVIGTVQDGYSGDVFVRTGTLRTGEVSGVPVIRRLLDEPLPGTGPVLIDCPPGSACAVMESIRDADYCVLVAEPTVFGAQNLSMVCELVRLFGKPFGVVLNKCQRGNNPSETYCNETGAAILGMISYDSALGAIHSAGDIAFETSEKYSALFSALLGAVLKEARKT